MIAFYKFMGRVNRREELFKPKGNVGTRTNANELAANIFRMEIRSRFISMGALKVSDKLLTCLGEILTCFKVVFDTFMKRAGQYVGATSVSWEITCPTFLCPQGPATAKRRISFFQLVPWPLKYRFK